DFLHVRRLGALGAINQLELHLLTFRQGFESVPLDGRVVNKHISVRRFSLNESKTLAVVKPLHRSNCHSCNPLKTRQELNGGGSGVNDFFLLPIRPSAFEMFRARAQASSDVFFRADDQKKSPLPPPMKPPFSPPPAN